MSYVAIYRKYRPQSFSQVKGQENIVQTLQNQIKNDRIGHAYLFTGTRGTGKTSVARIFAKAINCKNPHDGEPCDECENCKEIIAGNFLDVIEIDAASNTGVDDIRRVIEEVEYSPVSGRYKVYIIDEAHMLSGAAANAFLKTLEEPPAYAVFILATTEPHKLPVTILSRCQRYDFKRIATEQIAENIKEYATKEGIEAEEKAVRYIAEAGDGSMRDALSLLDKAVAFNTDGVLTYENTLSSLGTVDTESFSRIFRFVSGGDAYGAVKEFDREVKNGKDISRFISDLIWYLRNILLVNAGGKDDADILGVSEEGIDLLKEDASAADMNAVMRYIRVLSELINDLRFSGAKQVLCDVAMIKLAKPQMETDIGSVLDRIRQLEAGVYTKTEAVRRDDVSEVVFEDITKNITKPEVEQKSRSIEQEETDKADDIIKTEPKADINEGIPADIVCAEWVDIINGCSSPLLKIALEKAYVRKEDENTVKVFTDGNLAKGRCESRMNELKELIKKTTGCDIDLVIEVDSGNGLTETDAKDEKQEEAEIDMLIKKHIKMKVETEEA